MRGWGFKGGGGGGEGEGVVGEGGVFNCCSGLRKVEIYKLHADLLPCASVRRIATLFDVCSLYYFQCMVNS